MRFAFRSGEFVDPLVDFAIPYTAIVTPAVAESYDAAVDALTAILPEAWLDAYRAMVSHEPNVLEFNDGGFTYLFDFTSSGAVDADSRGAKHEQLPEDRVVAVYGRSHRPAGPRDSTRMKQFLGGGLRGEEKGTRDKGHFLAHTMGGGLDENLFPQLTKVNRGWSPRGRVFRAMECAAARRPGTFVFSRPIYADASWTPVALEYGLLLPELRLWVERFPN